jgi:WD40 repeat protein
MTAPKKTRRRGVVLSPIGQRKLEIARQQLAQTVNGGDRLTLEDLSEHTQIATSTVARVLAAELGVDKVTLECVFGALTLTLESEDYQKPGSKEQSPAQPIQPITSSAGLAIDIQGTSLSQATILPITTVVDWGEAIDVSTFYGRDTELAALQTLIQHDRCRLITILGMGGIGKTALSVKLAQQLLLAQPAFEFIVWRTLRNAPSLETLLTDIIQVLSDYQEKTAALTVPALLSRLLHYLHQHRCLLILDNGETLLQSGQATGRCRSGYEIYEELFTQLGEIPHQSCIVLTSREKPESIANIEGFMLPIRAFQLLGLPATDSDQLFDAIGLTSSTDGKAKLLSIYSGNPLALKIAGTSIRELFAGDIDAFLNEATTIFNGIRRLLDTQFDRLTPLESSVMYWLAINREWTTIAELHTDIVPQVPKARIMEALESLHRRSLIERQAQGYTQLPVVMEYVTDRLTTTIVEELETCNFDLFPHFALLKNTVKDYIRQTQLRLILGEICKRFGLALPPPSPTQIEKILTIFRQSQELQTSYAAGNLLNLCQQAEINLTDADFSCLTIRHAYLVESRLHHVNFAFTHWISPAFIQTFSNIIAMDFSPNGKWLATGDITGQVKLWQPESVELECTWHEHSTRLATGCLDCLVKIWDLEQQKCVSILAKHENGIASIDWSQDSRVLICADINRVKIWDTDTGEELGEWKTGAENIHSYIIRHPHLDRFAICSDDRIQLWDLETNTCLITLTGHTELVFSAAWHPDGVRLATASFDHTLKIWNTHTGECLTTLNGDNQMWGVHWLVANSHLNYTHSDALISSSPDGLLRVWDVEIGKCLRMVPAHHTNIWSLALHPSLPIVVSGSDEQNIKFWHTETWDCLRILNGYDNTMLCLSLSPDRRILAVGCLDQTLYLWDLQTNRCKALSGHTNSIWSVGWHHQGAWLASRALDGTVRFWDWRIGHCLKTFPCFGTISWHPDGIHLAIASWTDNLVRIWKIETQECIQTLQGLQKMSNALAWDRDGRKLVAGGYDFAVQIWDVQTAEILQTLMGHQKTIWSVTWSPDGERVASASQDQTIRIWDVATGECLQILHGDAWFWSVVWSTDGRQFASSDRIGQIQLWNLETGECVKKIPAHRGFSCQVLWTEEDSQLISCGSDGLVKIWDAQTKSCLQTLEAPRPYEGINITSATGISEAQKASLITLGATVLN